jgi:preprotein translocase subunit SecA
MFSLLTKKLFGSANDRIIKSFRQQVEAINQFESTLAALSDEELRVKTEEFRSRLKHPKTTLDDILPEAFASVREASKRVSGKRHFDMQLIGGIAMHKGMIAEMRTGEGKTLAATLTAYLNAITGHGVHVVTINDYLAKRDAQWMGSIYRFLGLTVGCIHSELNEQQRKEAYNCDITYGTNNEFGFDYLRDNLKFDIESMSQRKFHYAIVDEVDSILIDEARTPLIISGPTEDNSKLYALINKLMSQLSSDDYEIDEKHKSAVLTDKGHETIENLLYKNDIIEKGTSLYGVENILIIHHVNQALKANIVFKPNVDYIVKEGKVMIIDEFTGRIMDGRRYSDGLHQALEAKEKVRIHNENQTLASITFQNYFRMYPKLAGMTGTAMTEADELMDIYKLEVVSVPTNLSVQRDDRDDMVYSTAKEKYDAILGTITRIHATGQPILVGTVSIEKSEHVSMLLKKNKIKHTVLNARYHEQEASIIAQAGRFGAVTIATNMAGRGTDIMLGGNPESLLEESMLKHPNESKEKLLEKVNIACQNERQQILELGGLYVIGTERHESRRIDNQLRGRSGRQGDKGLTQFYLSMEDDLMRIFGSDKISSLLATLGLKNGEAITHPWVTKSLAKAQQKVEARNYDMRKNLLKYDDVMNEQRQVIYEERLFIIKHEDLSDYIKQIIEQMNKQLIGEAIPRKSLPEQWNLASLEHELKMIYDISLDLDQTILKAGLSYDETIERINGLVHKYLNDRRDRFKPAEINQAERHVILLTQDQLWKEHLHALEHLRTGINLRAYAQKDPLNEYKIEAFALFKTMLDEFYTTSLQKIFRVEISESIDHGRPLNQNQKLLVSKPKPAGLIGDGENSADAIPEEWRKTPRNAPCPCGSGKKYKNCHGSF